MIGKRKFGTTTPAVIALLLASQLDTAHSTQLMSSLTSSLKQGGLRPRRYRPLVYHQGDQNRRGYGGYDNYDSNGFTPQYASDEPKLCDKVRDIGYKDDDPRAYNNCQACGSMSGCSGRLEIVGAIWGLYEVTGVIRNQYDNGKREFIASEKYFGDHWDCAYKTLRITYRQCGQLVSEIAVDNTIAPIDSYFNIAQVSENSSVDKTCEERVEYHGTSPADQTLAQTMPMPEPYPYYPPHPPVNGAKGVAAAGVKGKGGVGLGGSHPPPPPYPDPYYGYGAPPTPAYGGAANPYPHFAPAGYRDPESKYQPFYYKKKMAVACYIKQVPKLPANSKSFIMLPSNNCFCCSCPEERAVKGPNEPDYYLNDAGKAYVTKKPQKPYQKPYEQNGYGSTYGPEPYGGEYGPPYEPEYGHPEPYGGYGGSHDYYEDPYY